MVICRFSSAIHQRLRQVLLNLLSNAVKFTQPGGSVVIAARRNAGGSVAFEVRDTGLGMTGDEVKVALLPFGQVETGDARRYQGTGLGLPLAQRLIELHGAPATPERERMRHDGDRDLACPTDRNRQSLCDRRDQRGTFLDLAVNSLPRPAPSP